MRISQKFLILMALFICLIVSQLLVELWINGRAEDRLQTMFQHRTVSLSKLGAMLDDSNVVRVRLLRATLAATPDAVNNELAQVDKLLANVEKAWATAKPLASSEDEEKLVKKYDESLSKYVQQRTAWINALRAGDFDKAKSVASDKLTTEAFRDSRNAIRDLFSVEEKLAAESFETSRIDARRSLWTSLSMVAVALIIATLAFRFILRPIVLHLRSAVHIAHEVSQGNLSEHIVIKGRDEVSQLLAALEEMQQGLRESVRTMRHTAEHLNEQASTLSHGAHEIHNQASTQSDAMSSAATAIKELTVSINVLSACANDAHTRTEQSGKDASAGVDVILGTRQQMHNVAETVTLASGTLQALGDKSQQIRQIVDVIHEIAEQTNLLALNAAIEAARAGEQGRGFAVVADEVRKLAERTGQSTQQIAKVIAEVLGETEMAITAMESGVSTVQEGTRLAEAAGESIRQIVSGMAQVDHMVTDISSAVREQTASAQNITRNIEQVSQTNEEVIAVANSNAAAAQLLSSLSDELNSAVARFRIE